MPPNSYHIRTMTRDELDVAMAWATSEGWNPGLHDADCFHRTDPNGFFMGFIGDEPIASISAVKYGESFGFIGFYIVKPSFRGQGYGLTLWNAALEYLKGRNIGLDGVVAQQDNYVKSGFNLAHRNIRYAGVGHGKAHNSACVPLAQVPTEAVIAYDRRFFPGERGQFTRCWITQPGSHAVGIIQEQALVGYGVLRPSQNGHKIGPLFANTAPMADELFRDLRARVPQGSSFYLDVPQGNEAAVALAERYAMDHEFETARMYTLKDPELPLNQIFGITTFELG